MIWSHAMFVPRMEKVTDNAAIGFIAIRSDVRNHDEDDTFHGDENSFYVCNGIGNKCWVGYGWCYPGLVCDGPDGSSSTCTLPTD